MAAVNRVTHKSIGARSLQGLQGNLAKLGKLQEQLSSGRQISRPSDDPGGSASAMRIRSEVRTLEQYARNATDGLGWLSTLDNTLTSSLDLVRRTRDLTLQGMSSGTAAAPGAAAALAAEVSSLREGMLNLANVRYLDRPIFGGTMTGTSAYNAAGVFSGDTSTVLRTVGDGVEIQVDATGESVFGTGTSDVFTIMSDIATKMTTDPSALGADLERLDAAMNLIQTKLAEAGTRYARVDRMRQAAEDRVLTLNSDLATIESIDLPKTIMELQMQDMSYKTALGAAAKVLQPSLLDFLR